MSAAKFKIESGVQLLARLTRRPNVENFYPMLFGNGPRNGDLIEINTDSCASALLIDLITEALMQSKGNISQVGVLIFNTDGNLRYTELVYNLKKKLLLSDTNCTNINNEEILNETISNLHVVDIYDANQFNTTIHNMENILTKHSNISIVIFNTLTAFYWSEQGYKITKMDLYVKCLINTIQKVTKDFKTICIYIKPEYFSSINKDIDLVPVEVNYKIQLLDHGKGQYQVNIKTSSMKTTRFYTISNKELKWT